MLPGELTCVLDWTGLRQGNNVQCLEQDYIMTKHYTTVYNIIIIEGVYFKYVALYTTNSEIN